VVRAVENALSSTSIAAIAVSVADAGSELTEFPGRFFSALSRLVSPATSTEAALALALAVARLEALRNALEEIEHVRPTGTPRAQLATARELLRLWPNYREALAASDIRDVQRLAEEGQRILDHSTERLLAVSAALRATETMADQGREPSLARRAMQALRVVHGDLDLQMLGTLGVARAESISGTTVSLGSGLEFLVLDLVARAAFDDEALRLKVAEVALACRDEVRIQVIGTMPGALNGLASARRELVEAAFQSAAALKDETRPGALVRRLSKAAAEQYEAAIPLYAWLDLLGSSDTTPEAYRRIVRRNSTELVPRLLSRMQATFVDAPPFLRHCASHGGSLDVDEEAGTVTIQLDSHHEVMSADDFLNRVLALFESLLAANWALNNAVEQAGLDVPQSSADADYLGLSAHNLAALMLEEFRGLDVGKFDVDQDVWTIQTNAPEGDVLAIALSLATTAGQGVKAVELCGAGPSEARIELPLEAYRAFADSDPNTDAIAAALAMLALRHATTSAGTCLLSRRDLEFAVVACGRALLAGDLGQIKRLRLIRDLASSHEAREVVRLCESLIASVRTGDTTDSRTSLGALAPHIRAPRIPSSNAVLVAISDFPSSPRPCDP
jgi:hypothetical protein